MFCFVVFMIWVDFWRSSGPEVCWIASVSISNEARFSDRSDRHRALLKFNNLGQELHIVSIMEIALFLSQFLVPKLYQFAPPSSLTKQQWEYLQHCKFLSINDHCLCHFFSQSCSDGLESNIKWLSCIYSMM